MATGTATLSSARTAGKAAETFIAPKGGIAHVSGDRSVPLLHKTIPEQFAETARKYADRDAAGTVRDRDQYAAAFARIETRDLRQFETSDANRALGHGNIHLENAVVGVGDKRGVARDPDAPEIVGFDLQAGEIDAGQMRRRAVSVEPEHLEAVPVPMQRGGRSPGAPAIETGRHAAEIAGHRDGKSVCRASTTYALL